MSVIDSEEQKQQFREDRSFYKAFRKKIEQQMNENFAASIKGSVSQEEGRKVSLLFSFHPTKS